MIQCTNCGYPVINGMHTCPNCLAEMPEEIVTPLLVEEDVYEYNDEEIPYCSLRPISLPGEKEMREKVYEDHVITRFPTTILLTKMSKLAFSSLMDIGL